MLQFCCAVFLCKNSFFFLCTQTFKAGQLLLYASVVCYYYYYCYCDYYCYYNSSFKILSKQILDTRMQYIGTCVDNNLLAIHSDKAMSLLQRECAAACLNVVCSTLYTHM